MSAGRGRLDGWTRRRAPHAIPLAALKAAKKLKAALAPGVEQQRPPGCATHRSTQARAKLLEVEGPSG